MGHRTISLIIAGIVLLTIIPRVVNLGQFLTADEKRWQANVAGFATQLSHGHINNLLQQPHPGITTQWFAVSTFSSPDWAIKKLPLVLWQIVITASIAYFLWRGTNVNIALLGAAFLAISPLLIAHTRIYAMDSLLAEFSILSLVLLFCWDKTKANQYLLFSGAAAAAALLSKLPGVILIPFTLTCLVLWQGLNKKTLHIVAIWLAGYVLGACLILPAIAIHPIATFGDFAEFFRSDDYSELHQGSYWYYTQTLFFFSTPLQMAGVMYAAYLITRKKDVVYKREIISLLCFAVAFVIMMSLGAKKGDRYILPVFLALDIITAYSIGSTISLFSKKFAKEIIVIIALLFVWQTYDVLRLNTYILSYINPITKPWVGSHRMGWGEGLDLAAEYINQKNNASDLVVATYYPAEFSHVFHGEAKPAHNWESENVDYVVLYRAMLERGNDSWEQDVLDQFQKKQPEKIIKLNGIPYVWIYNMR